jgi:hypothetical protein
LRNRCQMRGGVSGVVRGRATTPGRVFLILLTKPSLQPALALLRFGPHLRGKLTATG